MKKPTIFLAGDSTMADYPSSSRPQMGWGQKLFSYFTDEVFIMNKAVNGRSSKSFLTEGRLQEINASLTEGDYLFIQFGHNDSKPDEHRRTDPYTTYQENLCTFIEATRSKGATPVLLTPIQRRKYLDEHTLEQTHGYFPDAMRELAYKHSVMLLDMTVKTTSLLLELGPELSKELFMWLKPGDSVNFPEGARDDTHLNERGAQKVASLVVNSLVEHNSPLKKWIKI
ncbi:rhamnogalacturonan acetylesterase [Halobacillus shinanisalinarum]|uniref:Rhamnogalacturonan acetylesterase n=1 Tax=Halobacillus shinanisalinarum TaxID=2932258 RepID=A0ABY4GYS7_9BACI|nr:rhamnogalacturonan acetylesterase [Halobacillus shinanisalinarum]UOQ93355.1 rhamnogalacturonan acetylesterase [Halobacillus shinanisalinarum]